MKRLAILIIFFITTSAAYAQIINDECSSATTLIPTSTYTPINATLMNATTSSIAGGCTGNSDVFYKFVATSATATITVTGSSGLDAVVGLLSYCGNPVPLYCSDSYGNGGTETIYASGLITGSTYYIKVQAYSFYYPLTYTFTIGLVSQSTLPPVNDVCANAQIITPGVTCNPISGTLQNATSSATTMGCYGNSDVFYKFTATSSSANITVTSSYGLDMIVGLYNDCGAVSSLYCMDYYSNGGTEIISATGLTMGSTYYIKLQSYALAPSTYTFTVCVVSANLIIPQNDNCSGAINLQVSPTCNSVLGTLVNASSSSIANSCTFNNDVFYSFEASAETATVSVVPSSAQMNVAVGVFESCGGLNISCVNDAGVGGTENVILSGLITGNTYIVQVQDGGGSASGNSDFAICVMGASPPPPVNDECADAIAIYPGTTYTPITGTVKNATTSTITAACTGNSDVFYKFTAIARTATITVIGSSGFDPVVGLFKSCGTSFVDCADYSYTAGGTEILTPTNLIVGQTYYIKIQDYSTNVPTTPTFTVAVQSTGTSTDTDASASLQQVSLFPNPTQHVLNIENVQQETIIELLDVQGRVLLHKNISADDQIDVSEFAAGIYILKLSVDGVIENRRVVLTR